ncbi:MAG: hypothetical protein K2X38_16510 [Gemmataceae bacterium]|nr:hypothetical protein [Gemmataceae bacterium]
MTGFAQVVASRLAVLPPDEFLSKQYPHVIVDGLSLVETLRLMIRRFNVDWHWRWMRDTIEIGPLPQSGDLELETSGEFDVEGGFEADLHLNMPQLGDRVRAAGPAGTVREGNVTQIRVHFPDRPLAYHIRVAESPILLPMSQPSANSILHEGTLDQLDPLMVRVHLPSGDTCPVRGRLFALRLAACRVNVPLQAGDRVLVEWPLHALTTAPLRVFAEGETAPSTSLEIHAKELHVQPSKIKVLSDEVNIDELHP